MAEEVATAQADPSPKKEAAPKKTGKKPAAASGADADAKKSSHPKYVEMILDAIGNLKERGGSSRQAIFKYVLTNYELEDSNAVQARFKTGLKSGVESGAIKQVKGTGSNGSFKLGEKAPAKKKSPAGAKKEKEPKGEKAAPKKKKQQPAKSSDAEPSDVEMSEGGGDDDEEPADMSEGDAEVEEVVEKKTKAKAAPKPKKEAAPKKDTKAAGDSAESKPRRQRLKEPAPSSPQNGPASKKTVPKSPAPKSPKAKAPKSPKPKSPKVDKSKSPKADKSKSPKVEKSKPAKAAAKTKTKEKPAEDVAGEKASPVKKATKAKKPAAPKGAAAKKS